MIDFTKPELLQTRCGAEFEIIRKNNRWFGYVKSGMVWFSCYWESNGKCHPSFRLCDGLYDLIPKPQEPVVQYIGILSNGASCPFGLSGLDYAIKHNQYRDIIKLTITDTTVESEIVRIE